jgi:hypothetical protein
LEFRQAPRRPTPRSNGWLTSHHYLFDLAGFIHNFFRRHRFSRFEI